MRSAPLAPALALALVLVGSGAGSHAGNEGPLPYRIVVELAWGVPAGPASFLTDLEHELIIELTRAGCFREVRAEPFETGRPDDLRLRVVVRGFNERTEFEFRLADSNAPDLNTDRLTVAYLEAAYDLELRLTAELDPLRQKRFSERGSWRPLFHEDPREGARREMIDEVVRRARRFACKGSPASWSKQIEQARSSR